MNEHTPANRPAETDPNEELVSQRPAQPAVNVVRALHPLSLVALAIGGFSLIVGLYLAYAVDTGKGKLKLAIRQNESSLQEIANRIEEEIAVNRATIERLRRTQESLQEAVTGLQDRASDARALSVLAEAEHLLRIASFRIRLARDRDGALAALAMAEAELREIADPGIVEVRERVIAQSNALREVAMPDLPGVTLTLGNLAARVDRLPLESGPSRVVREREQPPVAAPAPPGDWRSVALSVWDDMKRLVVVRRADEKPVPLLAPEEEYFLRENLRLKLEGARLAALAGEATIYKDSLAAARAWLNTYFSRTSQASRDALAEIDKLAALDIRPRLPDLSDTVAALRSARDARERALMQGAKSRRPAAAGERP